MSTLKVHLEGSSIEVEKSISIFELYEKLQTITPFDYCVTSEKNFIIDHLLSNPTNTLKCLTQDLHLNKMMFSKDKSYELLYLLGQGGFSKVYLARNHRGQLFAMKMVEKEFILRNEKKALSWVKNRFFTP